MHIDQLKDVRGISIEQASPIVEVLIDNIILLHYRWWSANVIIYSAGYLDNIKVKFFINPPYFVENKGQRKQKWLSKVDEMEL